MKINISFFRTSVIVGDVESLKHEVEVYNPKTKKTSTLTLEGMNSFF